MKAALKTVALWLACAAFAIAMGAVAALEAPL